MSTDTIGSTGRYFDPVWRTTVTLTAVERELLQTWWVRRLAYVTHAGAAALMTTQSYSRLEHSLGVLTLTAHFEPDDQVARAAALLHDVGHLPLSHTFEGIAGLDHHRLGARRIGELAPVLRRHDLEPDRIIEVIAQGSGRRRASSALGLDHLDSFVRSGQAHGRTREFGDSTLSRLRLVDGVIDTDPVGADMLLDLVVGEAWSQCSDVNVAAYAVTRRIAELLLATADRRRRKEIAVATDGEFWGIALADPATADLTLCFRSHPERWAVLPASENQPGDLTYVKDRLYLVAPTIDGAPACARRFGSLPSTPIRSVVRER